MTEPEKSDDEVIRELADRWGLDPVDLYLEVFNEEFGE